MRVTVKLFGGLHEGTEFPLEEAMRGVVVWMPEGADIALLAKAIGVPESRIGLSLKDGERATRRTIMSEDSVIILGRFVAGG